ncbi:hypothetical protein SH584_11465 [Sphingomonas sp. LY29]|uniref:hypothetical protein n=1 Tax=Sphingomonas sp. LY29 TaxID=3095341 RepID=UPI002D769C22|nr:hypothetical protein [Sphingomonas sp. LY29]WRP25650.1 hypothetical protein SH584_11465 [Sphingomonas sp. LY29]
MEDTATPETGPVDAPASIESVTAEIMAGGDEGPADNLKEVTQELVNEAEGHGDSVTEPETEEDATDPAEEAADETEESPLEEAIDEQLVTVKVNGEERQVPLAEAIAGYSRTEDYKAKTAAVAEERRQLEAERQRVETEVSAKFANQLEEATNLFAQYDPVLAEAQRIDWAALKAQDPAAFLAAQDAVQDRLSAIQRMNQQVAETRAQHQQAQQAQIEQERAQRFDQAADEIVKQRPELADEAKFKAFAGETVEFLKGVGFTGEEIVDALDHRVLTLADKARQWDAHVAARQSLPEKRVVPKSAVKPLTSDGTGSQTSKPRFPSNATREAKGDWIARQILNSE